MSQNKDSENPFYTIWKFFTSVRLTFVVLLSIAATSIIGTIIPQNEAPSAYYEKFGGYLFNLFSALEIFDMYHSWWFQLLVVILTLNIIACSIQRLSSTWKIIFKKDISINPERFKKISGNIEFMEDRSSEDLIKRYASVISKRFKKHEVQKNEEGFYVFAEKQRWTRLGAYIVHTSVLLMLIGSLVGSIFGFDGFVNIPVGEKVSQIRLNKSHKLQPLDFEIQCDDFKVSFYESGAPKEYRSTLTIFENQRQTLKRDIIVNKPLRYRGINIFQSSYGKVPFENPDGNKSADLKSKKIELSIFNNNTGMSYSKETMMGEEIILPEGKGSFMLKNFSANATFHDQNIGAAFIGVLTEDKAEPKEVLLPIRYPSFDKMRNGYFVFSVENIEDLLNETETGYRYYTGLQVTRDPGVWIIYAGFVFMIFGCFVSFFMAHQQIFIEARKNGKKTSILISGISNKNPAGMKIKTEKLAKALKEGL